MRFPTSFPGILIMEITSAEPEQFFRKITMSDIPVTGVTKITELTYRFRISEKDYSALSRLLQKNGGSLRIIQKKGLHWKVQSLLQRPILLIGFMILVGLSYYLPSKVLIIELNGNYTIPSSLVLDAAEVCGLSFFAPRQEIRSEKVKNQLLSLVPQLQWAGINTYGCRAVLSVRERTGQARVQEPNMVTNIVADRDGYILTQTVTGGTPLVQPGDSVTAGQVLISGYTDCGFCIRAARASGEILAQTRHIQKMIMTTDRQSVIGETDVYYRISLLVRKKRINLWKDSRISDTGCGRMYEEYFISLPGGYQLPFAVCVDRYVSYVIRDDAVREADAYQMLQSFSDAYLLKQMNTGKILDRQQIFDQAEGVYSLMCRYICTELIGKEQREQIGE